MLKQLTEYAIFYAKEVKYKEKSGARFLFFFLWCSTICSVQTEDEATVYGRTTGERRYLSVWLS